MRNLNSEFFRCHQFDDRASFLRMETFKLGELFSGPGGMAYGAKMAAEDYAEEHKCDLPIEHVWGVDRDPKAIETYRTNIPGTGVAIDAVAFVNDVKEHPKDRTLKDFDPVTALAFGFPCNDFSLVGEQQGTKGDFGQLYKEGLKILKKHEPLFFVAENVSGIHSANSDGAFHYILKDLEGAGKHGYKLTAHLYKFEEYGIPQMRHRYIIVGIRGDQDVEFKVPAPTHKKPMTVGQKLSEPHIVKPPHNNDLTRQSAKVEERLLFTPPWKNAWYLDDLLKMDPDSRREALKKSLLYESEIAHLSDDEIEERIKGCMLHCTRARMSHIYRRLDKNKPAYTITGSGGGGTHVYHWKECRALTNRERARLQTFPDTFEFKGSKEKVRKQIGMAVPPEAARIIFRAILDTFGHKPYPRKPLPKPNYTPMDEEEFNAYRFKRYRQRLRTLLRNKYDFDASDFNSLSDQIKSWISSEVEAWEAALQIEEKQLIPLLPKTRK